MARKISACAVALLLATALEAETVRGKITPSNSYRTFGFWPGGAQVELTLMWLKKSAILDLRIECRDEIGSLFFEATSESSGDRIERFDFGGWAGGTCTVTISSLEPSRTRYLLNLRYSFDEPFLGEAGSRRPRALLTPLSTESVPGLAARLAEHRARLAAHR